MDTKTPAAAPPGYRLVWSDEFNYTGKPDPAKWTYETGFVRNNEPQLYTDRLENARVEDGHLVIECRKEHFKNPRFDPESKNQQKRLEYAEYTSASVTTRGLASWTYGRIEVRAKLPNARGDWPAIWMLGDNRDGLNNQPRRPWPWCGEMDIMELWGARDPNVVQAHLIYQASKNQDNKGGEKSEGGPLKITSPGEEFHCYAAEWLPDRVDFYVDDTKYQSITIDRSKVDANAFHEPMYLLLNLALEPRHSRIDDSIFPQKYLIDSVRVFQKK